MDELQSYIDECSPLQSFIYPLPFEPQRFSRLRGYKVTWLLLSRSLWIKSKVKRDTQHCINICHKQIYNHKVGYIL